MTRLLTLIFLLANLPLMAQDCGCQVPGSLNEALKEADYGFTGKVIAVETNWISGGWKFTFQVDSSWKRAMEPVVIVNTGWEKASWKEKGCGYLFQQGQSYVVFVKRKFTPKTSVCSGNRLLNEVERELPMLGKSLPTRHSPQTGNMIWTMIGLGMFSFMFLAFVLFGRKLFFKGK